MSTIRLIQCYRTTYRCMDDLLTDIAVGLLAFAKSRDIRELPITLEMLQSSLAMDSRMGNSARERGHDTIGDMVATIGRRLPEGEDLEISVEDSRITIWHTRPGAL